jgi:hypothetical protein
MEWRFQLDDSGIVRLEASGMTDNGDIYDMHEQVKPGGNFCGVKYAALRAAKSGALDVSWLRFAKWRAR